MRFNSNNLKLSQKGMILAVVPVVFELIFIITLVYLLSVAEHQIWLENKIKTIVVSSHELTKSFYDAGAGVIFFGITHNEGFIKKYDENMELIPAQLKQLKADVLELNPKDKSFEDVQESAFKGLDTLRSIRARADLGDGRLFGRDVRKILQEFIESISRFVDHFKQLQQEAPEKSARSRSLVVYWLEFGVIVNIAMGIALAKFFNVGTSRRLAVLMDNTKKLSRRKELNPPIQGEDELGQLDRVFRKMANELEDAARRKQELVAMVSHDLRTPLMSIQVSLELLSAGAMGELPDQARKELTVAEYSASRLIHLINDLLDIDRMEAGRFDLSPRTCELGWIFERCLHSVHAFAERSKVSVVVPEDEDAQVYADPDRLAQVITNLLSNAIKFSPAGSEVVVSYEDLPDATLVKITDHGRGIPPGYEQKIFERFQQVNSQDSREKKGTGLGLAICKAIIDAHQGAIGVKSKEGQGSTFWFRVPKQKQQHLVAMK